MSTPIESLPRSNNPPHVQDPTLGPPLPVLQEQPQLQHHQQPQLQHPQQLPQEQQQPSPQQMENMMPPQPMYYAPLPPPRVQHLPPQLPPAKPVPLEEPTLWQMFKDNIRLVIFVFFILLLSQMEGVRTLTQRIVHMTSVPDSMSSLVSKILVALLGSFVFIAGSSYVI